MKIYLAPIFAFILTLILTKLALVFFPKWNLLDKPHNYGLKRAPIPYYGGLIIFFVIALNLLFFLPLDKHLIGFLLAGGVLVATSFIDDKKGLSPLIRLLIQFTATVILILSGIGIEVITNPFGGDFNLTFWKIPFEIQGIEYHLMLIADLFTVLWVMGMINTMNWLDGISGLTSGIATIGGLTLGFLSLTEKVNQPEIAIMSFVLAAVAFAFWFFDFYPPKILMGDTGSMFLGFMLAVIGIYSGGKVATAFLVMGFPILDAAWVILRRLKSGKSPFKGDLKHFHHRLLEIGLTEKKALVFIYAICALFGVSALFLDTRGKFLAMILMFLLMVLVGRYLVVRGEK